MCRVAWTTQRLLGGNGTNDIICEFVAATLIYAVVKKTRTHVTFSNNFNKYLSILIIFGTVNPRVCSLQVCNWWILIKLGTSLLYFHCSHLHQTALTTEMGLCKENHNLFFKNVYEFEDLELTDPWKNLQQKDRQRPLWMIFETSERPAAAASECGLVWYTADSCRWGDWRMERHLWACVHKMGRHFEHLLQYWLEGMLVWLCG